MGKKIYGIVLLVGGLRPAVCGLILLIPLVVGAWSTSPSPNYFGITAYQSYGTYIPGVILTNGVVFSPYATNFSAPPVEGGSAPYAPAFSESQYAVDNSISNFNPAGSGFLNILQHQNSYGETYGTIQFPVEIAWGTYPYSYSTNTPVETVPVFLDMLYVFQQPGDTSAEGIRTLDSHGLIGGAVAIFYFSWPSAGLYLIPFQTNILSGVITNSYGVDQLVQGYYPLSNLGGYFAQDVTGGFGVPPYWWGTNGYSGTFPIGDFYGYQQGNSPVYVLPITVQLPPVVNYLVRMNDVSVTVVYYSEHINYTQPTINITDVVPYTTNVFYMTEGDFYVVNQFPQSSGDIWQVQQNQTYWPVGWPTN